jgi:hypothetical protein
MNDDNDPALAAEKEKRPMTDLTALTGAELIASRDELLAAAMANRQTYNRLRRERNDDYIPECCTESWRICRELGPILLALASRPLTTMPEAARFSSEVPGLVAKVDKALANFWEGFGYSSTSLLECVVEEDGRFDFAVEQDRVQAATDALKLCLLRLGWSELEWGVFLEARFRGIIERTDEDGNSSLMFAMIPPAFQDEVRRALAKDSVQ